MQINFNYFNNRNTVLRPNEITQREGFYKSFYLLQITGHFIWGKLLLYGYFSHQISKIKIIGYFHSSQGG